MLIDGLPLEAPAAPLADLPLNPTGKIDRVGLKRMTEDHLHPHGLGA